jgi:hypothetical protein
VDEQRDGRGREPHVWAPPDAGASRDAAVGRSSSPPWAAEADVPDGPPPPPWERRRRTRRRWLVGLAAALVVAVPVALGLAGTVFERDGTLLADPDEDEQAGGDASEPAPDDDELTRPLDAPDLGRLEGPDAAFAELLIDIDASEQAMLAFQFELQDVFREHGLGADQDALFDALAAAGGEGADRLEAAREPLEDPRPDVRAETVREVYLEHLDSWVRYMRAVEAEPALLGTGQDDSDRYTLSINTTAAAFARSLEEQLPEDVDPDVERMAEQLLDRGFRTGSGADV